MKLFLNKTQKTYVLEILKASENNAVNGKDAELAKAFSDLHEQIKPENQAYIKLNRNEAEALSEFCDIVRKSLDKAINFLQEDKNRDPDEVESLKIKTTSARDEIEDIIKQIQEKIKQNP